MKGKNSIVPIVRDSASHPSLISLTPTTRVFKGKCKLICFSLYFVFSSLSYIVLEYCNHFYMSMFGLWNKSSKFLLFYKKIHFDYESALNYKWSELCAQTKVLLNFLTICWVYYFNELMFYRFFCFFSFY